MSGCGCCAYTLCLWVHSHPKSLPQQVHPVPPPDPPSPPPPVQSVEFPDSPTGVIAPGLHCLVRVRFSPDSLADYDDALEVTTDVGPLSVPLLGRRPPPSLTLLRDIDCGAAVVGNWRVMRLPFANLGGDGAFRLVPSGQPSRPPSRPSLDGSSVSLESAGARDQMRVGDFVVWPTSLDVPAGAEAALWVAFRPSRAGKCSAKFRMVCDNCNVRVFALKGTGADVELSVCRVDQRVPLVRVKRGGVHETM